MKPLHSLLTGLYVSGLLVFGTFGCGGGAEGTGAAAVGVEGSTKLSDLLPAQVEAVCGSIRARSNEAFFTASVCNYLAFTSTPVFLIDSPLGYAEPITADEAAAQCRNAIPFCEEKYSNPDRVVCDVTPSAEGSCILNRERFRASCDVPVSVLLGCIDESLHAVEVQNSSVSCDDRFAFTRDQYVFPETGPQPSCDAVKAQCGEFGLSFSPCGAEFYGFSGPEI